LKTTISIISAAAALLLLSGCAAASSESEVMIDTSSKTQKHVPGGLPGSEDTSRMEDPFLSGGN
jgi:uncharacterized lipoprotein YajG